MRYLTGVVILMAAGVACSRAPERTMAAAPTSPSAVASSSIVTGNIGGVSGKMDILFPARLDSFQFRLDLEPKYQTGLGRAATTTYVDREGEVVWIQEYLRYRVNGCDHTTAMARVLAQIDGAIAGGICAAPPEGLISFPSRADALQARRELETKYQAMGRGLSVTYVDIEGAVIWIQEYLRYRINACDHATALAKVFAQIDGGPVAATCFVACSYVLNATTRDVSSVTQSQTFEVRPNPVACNYTVESDASWLTFPSDLRTGSGFTAAFPFTVSANNGGDRIGHITFSWSGGSTRLTVFQSGTPFAAVIEMFDQFRGPSATTECHIRSSSTPCRFIATANLPGGGYTYAWSASYFYGVQKSQTQTGSSNQFTVTEQCNGTGSSAEGASTDFAISVTITDDRGNTVTLTLPARLRLFTC